MAVTSSYVACSINRVRVNCSAHNSAMVACGTLMEERNSTSAGSHSGSRAMTEGGCEADSDVLVLREMLINDDVVDGAES